MGDTRNALLHALLHDTLVYTRSRVSSHHWITDRRFCMSANVRTTEGRGDQAGVYIKPSDIAEIRPQVRVDCSADRVQSWSMI